MTVAVLALVLSVSAIVAALTSTLYSRRHVRLAYARGIADAGAALVAVAAAELGYKHPLLDRMAERLGSIAPD